jgi:MFS family permease
LSYIVYDWRKVFAMRNFWNVARQFDQNILRYLLVWSMIGFAYFGIIGVVLNLYLVRLGYGPEFIGRLHASGQLAWAIFALPAGLIGRKWGIKQALIAANVLNGVGTIVMIAAEALPSDLLSAGLTAGWLLTWIGAALVTVNGAPYLMAVITPENRGYGFSAQQAAMGAATFAGSLLAGALPGWIAAQFDLSLEQAAPYRFTLMLAPLAYLAAALVFTRADAVQAPDRPTEQKAGGVIPVRIFIFFGLLVFIQSLAEGIIRPFYNLYLDTSLNVPVAQIGSTLGFSSLLLVLVSLATPAVLSRWGIIGAMKLSMLGFMLFAVLLAAVPLWPMAALIFLGIGSMLTILATARGIYGQEIVKPYWRTTSSAIATIGMAVGWSAATWAGGQLITSIGFQNMFLTGAVLGLFGAGLILAQKWSVRPTQPQEPGDAETAQTANVELL